MIDSALFAGRFLRGINMNFMQRCMAFLQWMDQEKESLDLMISKVKEMELKDAQAIFGPGVHITAIKNEEGRFLVFYCDRVCWYYLFPCFFSVHSSVNGWLFQLGKLPMTDKEFTIQLYDENIKAADIYLLLSDTGEVSYYNDQLITYSKDESITLMQVLLRSYLGDALYMTQIRKIIPSETPLPDSFPLVDILARFTEKGHALQANQLFSTYEPNVKSRNMLRFDIIAGVSSYLDTVNEYFYDVSRTYNDCKDAGARLCFLSIQNEYISFQELFDLRIKIQDHLEKWLQRGKICETGTILGAAIAPEHAYIDLLLCEENEKALLDSLSTFDAKIVLYPLIQSYSQKNESIDFVGAHR